MSETRKLTEILASDVVGYSQLAGADEDRTLARIRTLGSDLIDPIVSVHRRRVVTRSGGDSTIALTNFGEARKCRRKQNPR
jgi:adenylate cyclase